MFRKLFLKYIAFYTANRDDALRVYIKCIDSENNEPFTVIAFFIRKDATWVKENNEGCTLPALLDALNSQTELVVDTIPSQICESLLEGTFISEK